MITQSSSVSTSHTYVFFLQTFLPWSSTNRVLSSYKIPHLPHLPSLPCSLSNSAPTSQSHNTREGQTYLTQFHRLQSNRISSYPFLQPPTLSTSHVGPKQQGNYRVGFRCPCCSWNSLEYIITSVVQDLGKGNFRYDSMSVLEICPPESFWDGEEGNIKGNETYEVAMWWGFNILLWIWWPYRGLFTSKWIGYLRPEVRRWYAGNLEWYWVRCSEARTFSGLLSSHCVHSAASQYPIW